MSTPYLALGAALVSLATFATPPVQAQGEAPTAAPTVVFKTNFDKRTLPRQIAPGVAELAAVQGFAGLGKKKVVFGGNMLRSPTGNTVTLTLTNLPVHTRLHIDFLFAAIDSLDGTGTTPPEGDFFRVDVDGGTIFRESFANALPSQVQSYVPGPGLELARHVDLGFGGPGGYYTDSAYRLGAEPAFRNIAHTGSTAVITFVIEGPGIQSLDDESWGIDQLKVAVSN